MKLHYSKILLFSLPLNILVTSSFEHNKYKPYIIRHTGTTTSRILSECDLYMPKYDNDADIKSVKENFDRQTSRRFEEYEKRMITQRKKYKEQRDKDIQKIILKDKVEKSLSEKVEKGCFRCGCGLGGVAASVGIFGPIAVNEWSKAATVVAIDVATKKGIEAGVKIVIEKMSEISNFLKLSGTNWSNFINEFNYKSIPGLVEAAKAAKTSIGKSCVLTGESIEQGCDAILNKSDVWFSPVVKVGEQAAADLTGTVKDVEIGKVTAESIHMYSAIGYTVLAILIILLVMVIIYLVLRYRRKQKMNKKLQYTKLLNQ